MIGLIILRAVVRKASVNVKKRPIVALTIPKTQLTTNSSTKNCWKVQNGSYPGTKEWDKNNGTSSGSYGGTTSVNVNINEEEIRESVYNGTYNAFLDIFQRYGDELTGGKELKFTLTESRSQHPLRSGRTPVGSL